MVLEALLVDEVAERLERWDRRLNHNMRALAWPGIAAVLQARIQNRHASLAVRRLAISIARACGAGATQEALLAVALDEREPPHLRDDAITAIGDIGDPSAKQRLIPLATEYIPDDDHDQIKGTALRVTCPDVLGVSEALQVLTPPRDDHFIGAYAMFIRNDLPPLVGQTDLSAALAWAESIEPQDDPRDVLGELANEVLTRAWERGSDPRVAHAIAKVVRRRLLGNVDSLGCSWDNRSSSEALGADQRRPVIVSLIGDVGDGSDRDDKIHPRSFLFTRPALLTEDDHNWLLDQLEAGLGEPDEPAWASVIGGCIRITSPHLDRAYELMLKSTELRAQIGGWFDAVLLDSAEASELQRRYTQQVTRQARREQRIASRDGQSTAHDMDAEIQTVLSKCQSDSSHWPTLVHCLAFGPNGEAAAHGVHANPTTLPGWERADESVRERIIACALAYIRSSDNNPAVDLDSPTRFTLATVAPYQALSLLQLRSPAAFDALGPRVWAHWTPAIVRFPYITGVEDTSSQEDLLRTAIEQAPNAVAGAVGRRIDIEKAHDQGHIPILFRLGECDEPATVKTVFQRLSEPGLQRGAAGDLLEWCLPRDIDRALSTVMPRLLQSATSRDPADYEVSAEVTSIALTVAPGDTWAQVAPLFETDRDWAREVMQAVAHREKASLVTGLSDDDLASLVLLLWSLFPPGDDPPLQFGVTQESPRQSVRWFRDRLLNVLASRGSDRTVETLRQIAASNDTPGLRALVREAEDARRSRRQIPEAAQVIELAQYNDSHLILSPAHLQALVLRKLRRVQDALINEQPPGAKELWQTQPRRPRHEEEIADWLAHRLRQHFAGARLIDREVQVAPSTSGRGRGKSVDLKISAATGTIVQGADMATVYVEIKGIWNRTVKTDMRNQLVDRYLAPTRHQHGVYLVLWFPLEAQEREARRVGPATSMTYEEVTSYFTSQAAEVSKTTDTSIEAFVLDGSIPGD
jgi:hypothetical protein